MKNKKAGPMKNSERYLTAFIAIEGSLRKITGGSKEKTFSALLGSAVKKDATVRRYESDLRQYNDLRNAIVHKRRGDEPIAEPHPGTVEDLRRIQQTIANPPKAEKFVQGRSVRTCEPSQRVGEAVRIILDHSYSQLPVVRDGRITDLLTTDAIARWVGEKFKPDMDIMLEEDVEGVLQFSEDRNAFRIVNRKTELAAILEIFDESIRAGDPLQAVLINQTGSSSNSPLGIVTAYDLPAIYGLLSG